MTESVGNVASDDELKNLVLIHGWGFGGRIWSDFIPYIKDQWRITNINLPGYGVSEKIAHVDLDETNIDQIVNLISADIPEKAIILAWSLGGLVATRFACIRKDITALILVASSPCFLNKPDWQHGVDPVALDQLARSLSENKTKALQQFSGLVAMGDEHPRETISKLSEHVNDNAPEIEKLKAGLEILRQEDLRSVVTKLCCPIGMIFGEKDMLVKCSTGKAMQALRADINTIEIADTGHAPFLTRPQETADAITKLTDNFF